MRLLCTLVTAVLVGSHVVGVVGPAEAVGTDHSTAIQLAWDGREYSDTTIESFVGFPVATPGDSTSRTLTVRNDGPTDATLRVSIINVDLLPTSTSDPFYTDLHIAWTNGRASINDLDEAGTTRIMNVPLAKGETTPVTIGFDFPIEATSGNASKVGSRSGSFDVLLELGSQIASPESAGPPRVPGDPDASSDAGESADSTAGAEADASSASDTRSDGAAGTNPDSGLGPNQEADSAADPRESATARDFLPRTGGAMWWVAVLGAVLTGTGSALVRVARRRNT